MADDLTAAAPGERSQAVATGEPHDQGDVIDRWVSSMRFGSFDLSLFTPDATVWHSHDDESLSLEEERRRLELSRERFAAIRAQDVEVVRHHRGALLRYMLQITGRDGTVQRTPAWATLTIRDGKIARLEEFISSEPPRAKDRSAWEVGRAPVARAHDRIMAEIDRLGLERHVVELEIFGFTVLPPRSTGDATLAQRLRDAVLAVAERRTGVPADLATGEAYGERQAPLGRGVFVSNLLFEDPVFEQALMHEPSLTLVTYLLGEQCILNQQAMMVKGPGGDGLSLHADTQGIPEPFPYVASAANATWALTDYTVDNGCLAVVRGSHHLCRNPTPAENSDRSLWHPLEVPAGSMIVWHGNLWHGAYARRAPGLRVSISNYFSRWAIGAQDRIRDRVTPEMLARNPPRFAYLAGLGHPSYFREDGLNAAFRHRAFDENRFSVDSNIAL